MVLIKQPRKFSDEVKQINYDEQMKMAGWRRSTRNKVQPQTVSSNSSSKILPKPSTKSIDPLDKAKKVLDDCNSALEMYMSGSLGPIDPNQEKFMTKTVQQQILNYFNEVNKSNKPTVMDATPMSNEQSGTSLDTMEHTFDLSQFT